MQAEPASSIDTLASIALKALGLPDQPVSVLEEFSARRCPRLSCGSLPSEGHSLPSLRVLDLTGEAVNKVSCTAPAPQSDVPRRVSDAFKSKHPCCCPCFAAILSRCSLEVLLQKGSGLELSDVQGHPCCYGTFR